MIKTYFFIALFCIFPVLWAGLIKKSGVQLLAISIPSSLIWAILISQYIGYPILFFHLNEYRASYIQDQSIIWQMFIWSSYSVFMILFGFVVARVRLGPIHYGTQFNSFHRSLSPARSTELWILLAVFVLSLAVLYSYILRVGWGNLAVLAATGFIETNASSSALRSAMGNAFEGKYYWYRLFMRDFLSISSFGFFAQWLICKKHISFLVFFGSFVATAFSMIMATEKGPFLFYLISLLIIYLVVKQGGRLSFPKAVLCAAIGLVIVGIMYVYFMGTKNIWCGMSSGFSRITNGEMGPLYDYLTIFPDKEKYLLGRSFPNPRGIFPFEQYRLSVEVKNIVEPNQEKIGIIGSSPTFFWGEMYANFGYLGILVPPFFVGYVVYAINIIIFRLPMTPLVLAIYVWFLMHIKNISSTGLSSYIIDITGLIMAIFTLIVMGIIGRGVIRFRRKRLQDSFARCCSTTGRWRGRGL